MMIFFTGFSLPGWAAVWVTANAGAGGVLVAVAEGDLAVVQVLEGTAGLDPDLIAKLVAEFGPRIRIEDGSINWNIN